MKKYTLLLLLSIFSIVTFAQKKEKIKGDRNVTTVTNGFDKGFTAIEVFDNLKVTLTKSLQNSYTLTTDKNLHDVIQLTVNEGVLRVYTTSNIVKSKELHITLSLNNLESIFLKDDAELKMDKVFDSNTIIINAQNSSQFDIETKASQATITMLNDAKGKLKLHADQIAITMADKTNLDADINTDNTNASLSSSAKLRLDGNSDKVLFTTIDSSELDAKRLKVSSANVNTKDKSELHIDARRNLAIDARDKSKIFVYSEPKIDIKKFTDRAEIIKR
ncbi:MAG TPA: DUF2807 domain-containing protein [Dysgonamonadaceae bacterium]|nr:DUF2807 domain-containing protein [Dysgonamonadaceae bacterium]